MGNSVVIRRMTASMEVKIAAGATVYVLAAVMFSWGAYVALLRQYAFTHFFALPPMLFLGLLGASVVIAPRAPATFLKSLVRERWVGAAATITMFCLSIAAFSTFKHHIPAVLPFFADRPLADLDEIIHFGQPWHLAHAALPEIAGPILAILYGPAWFVEWLGLVLVAAFVTNDRLRIRYLLSFAIIIVLLGTILRAAGASAGPIFYDRMFGGERFADLLVTLKASPSGASMLAAAEYLYSSYMSDEAVFGAGISAMPSIHVAMAVLNALFLSSLNRWAGVLGWAFAAAIMVGSVYFGWHYALDGYVSVGAVLLIWRFTSADKRKSER